MFIYSKENTVVILCCRECVVRKGLVAEIVNNVLITLTAMIAAHVIS